MLDDGLAHLDPSVVLQVHQVRDGLDTSDSPDTKPMEAGGADSTICLICYCSFEPVVNLCDVFERVDMLGRRGPIGIKPDKLGRVEDGRNG